MSTHPTDRELSALLDGSPDEVVRSHTDECAFCRSRLRDAGPRIDVPAKVGLAPRHIELPSAVTDALPERGDVWRLAWQDTRELGVVLEAGSDGITVAPLFDDPGVADEWTLLFDAGASDLGIEFGIGAAHRLTLPLFVCDARLAQLDEDAINSIENAAAAYRRDTRPEGRTGRPLHGQLDPRIDDIGEIIEEFATLTEATWLEPVVESAPVDWLAFADLGLVDTYRLYELSSGASPEPDEIALAEEHGFRISSRPLDERLVAFLDTPRNSTLLRRRAARLHRAETDVRREAAAAMTNQRFALAARGGDGSVDWAPLLEQHLDETGD